MSTKPSELIAIVFDIYNQVAKISEQIVTAFNKKLSKICIYHRETHPVTCVHHKSKHKWCCVVNCPLSKYVSHHDSQRIITYAVRCFRKTEKIKKTLTKCFNYKLSELCEHCDNSDDLPEEVLFMNWQCNYKNDNEHCCFAGCPLDTEEKEV